MSGVSLIAESGRASGRAFDSNPARAGAELAPRLARDAARDCPCAGLKPGSWLPDMDLNHDKQIQSLLCYRYTIGQSVQRQRLGILG